MSEPRWPLAVSTLGMPGCGVEEACATALAGGCEGLELRAHPDNGVHTGLDPAGRERARATIAGAGLRVLAVAGYTRVAAPAPDDEVLGTLRAEIALAADLGAPFLRVFPGAGDGPGGGSAGGDPAGGLTEADVRAARRLRAVAPLAAGRGVRVLVETHDSHGTGAAVRRLLDAAAVPEATGAVWDVLHTWRNGEAPARTHAELAGHIGYVQIKDAVGAADTTPVPLGTGGVPLDDVREVLAARAYTGWISLEWERVWYPQVAPVAEILPAARAWAGGGN
ncbi:sugar phosphate isomerase/epimerase [Thermocatellispora tengchongensis]|uniref:Sugar phosphate isomerase/epimerase n=1 Tax=Thermocatellispora tengchongensis TaxID=1073253 RepID=A0A840PGE7_9ACTN|nr:sugar phosphate isomerase/epimerase family protein [Thermocatellispora tengchongensis]MBB5138222.1 sugar phosphate isomerase/epimerase [Thermocatellispora tengchongensis]